MPDPALLLLLLPVLLLALVLHEYAHAWVADRLGDPTPRRQGRLSLNPLVHLDPIGTLVLIVTQRVGWARPVPIDLGALGRPRHDLFWIAAAGPAANLVQAALLGLILRTIDPALVEAVQGGYAFRAHPGSLLPALLFMVYVGFQINIVLAWFNLLPIPPLDGSRLLLRFLGPGTTHAYLEFSRYSFLIILGIVFFFPGILWAVLGPPVAWTSYLLGGIRIM